MSHQSEPASRDAPELTYEQKIAVALNDLPAAGLPELIYTDGPNGIRGAEGATAFPSGLAVAAAFDRRLATSFGEALARESLAAGRNGILAPGLDIARVPWAGRIAEALGEDPVLVGEIGAAIVRGIQSLGVLAVPKHFVANNFEHMRTGRGSLGRRSPALDVRVSPRALREIYAEPFRRALMDGEAGAVLSSYNRIDGEYVSESAEVIGILRDEWGWQGFVTPDFLHAVRDDQKALDAGLDFPALGGLAGRTEEMVRALDERVLDDIVRRSRWALDRIGVPVAPPTTEPLDDPLSQDLAQEILEKGAVLLANDGTLPLRRDSISSIAVVAPEDMEHLLVMGGSAAVTLTPDRITSLSAALGEASGAQVTLLSGTQGDLPLPTLQGAVHAEVRDDVSGNTAILELDSFELFEVPEGIGPDWSGTLEAELVPAATGAHRFSLTFGGEATLFIDGRQVATGYREASPMIQGPEYPVQALVHLTAGTPVALRVEFATGPAFSIPPIVRPGVKVGVLAPDNAIDNAAAHAAQSDVAVVVVGRVSGEAMDVDSLSLPGDQEQLIRAVAAACSRTIVITCGAGPIVMPWADDVAAVLHVWNPGERFGPAAARLLMGDAEPGGRLPLTFPMSESLTPVSTPEQYPGVDGNADYSEDLLVGYRWFHATDHTPAFAFGHGLGYTSFKVDDVAAAVHDERVVVSAVVENTGDRAGSTVLQVYVTAPDAAASPARTLIGFARVDAGSHTTTSVRIDVPVRDFAVYDDALHSYRVHGGSYLLELGRSSVDIVARTTVELVAHTYTRGFPNDHGDRLDD